MLPLAPNMMASIAELCEQYGVAELSVFGSAARDDFDPERSDYDFLVEYKPAADVSLFEYFALQNRLSDLLGRKVDLVSKPGLKPRIREEVLKEARTVYASAR
ncbi:MAG: nucleotidyltransferase family protein [Terriglobales bacterium]